MKSVILFSFSLLICNSIFSQGNTLSNKSLGHFENGIAAIAYTPDMIAVSGKSDSLIKMFDARSFKLTGEFNPGDSIIKLIALSPGNDRMAVTDDHGLEIKIFSLNDYKKISVLNSPQKVTAMAFFPDKAQIAVGDDSGTISILDVITGEKAYTMPSKDMMEYMWKDPKGEISRIVISPSGKYLATVESHGSILVSECKPGAKMNYHLVTPYRFADVAFSPDEKYFFAGGYTFGLSLVFGKDNKMSKQWTDYGSKFYLYDLDQSKQYAGSSSQIIMENVYWSADGEKMYVHAAVPDANGDLDQDLFVAPCNDMLNGKLNFTQVKMGAIKGNLFSAASYCNTAGNYFTERDKELCAWKVNEPFVADNSEMQGSREAEKTVDKTESAPAQNTEGCSVVTLFGKDGGIPGSKIQMPDSSIYDIQLNGAPVVVNGAALFVFEGENRTTGIKETRYFIMSDTKFKEVIAVNLKGVVYTFYEGGIWQSFKMGGEEYKGNVACGGDGKLHLKLFEARRINISKDAQREITDVIIADSKIYIQVLPVGYSQLTRAAQNVIRLNGVTDETLQNVMVDQFVLSQDGITLIPRTMRAVDDNHKVIYKKNNALYEVNARGSERKLTDL